MIKIKEPKVNYCVESLLDNVKYYQDALFRENVDKLLKIKEQTIDGCIFEKIDFNNIELYKVDFLDVIFENCDLSNKRFDFRLVERVKFKNCKMVGTSFIGASLRDVTFECCLGKYINFAQTRISNFKIKDSDFTSASFLETELKNVEFENVNFSQSEISHTNFSGIDFSSCKLSGFMIDFDSLKGIIVNQFQAAEIVSLLGIEVKY